MVVFNDAVFAVSECKVTKELGVRSEKLGVIWPALTFFIVLFFKNF
jgi:hypothetical protein